MAIIGAHLDKGLHAHFHGDIERRGGVGDFTGLLEVVLALLLLLALVLGAVGGVALLVIAVVTLFLHIIMS